MFFFDFTTFVGDGITVVVDVVVVVTDLKISRKSSEKNKKNTNLLKR
jgi:hypothetical protein